MTDLPPPEPPGWYHGEGDPPGTQRYWNGTTWIGEARLMSADPAAGGRAQYASWWARAGALLVDLGLWFGTALALSVPFNVVGSDSPWVETAFVVVFVVFLLGMPIYNAVFLQSWNAATVGKQVAGIAVVRDGTNDRLPPGSLFGRFAMTNLLRIVPYIGPLLDYLWPLWDKKKQTIHDKVVRSIVVNARSLPTGTAVGSWREYRWLPGRSSTPSDPSAHEGPYKPF